MEKSKKIKLIAVILTAALILGAGALAMGMFVFQGTQLIKADGEYSFSNPEQIKAEPDAGFVIDGVLDEAQYQNSNWLKLKNTEGGAGVDVAATSYFGENGLYIVFDITESSRIYFNPNRPSYLNSCIEMYLASSDVASMSNNQILEIDMLPTGDLNIRQRTAKDNWVNVASTDDMMAVLGATTKGGPVNSEECSGYTLELFMPWAYLKKLGMDIADSQDFFYVNPVHITSYNYDGTQSGTDRYWYSFATQLGGDGWNDVPQYFRFGANGALGTAPVKLSEGANYTITGNDSVITGMITNVDITPDAGYTLSSILVNGQEYIHRVAYNKDGSVTLQLRGQEGGLTVSATAEAVTEGKKTLSGTVLVHKLGGDTLEGVSVSYKGPGGEKPIAFESDGSFLLSGLEQGYYIITAEKNGYAPINRGIYLSRDVETELTLEYQVFRAEVGYNWILDDQNDGVLNRFGGSGKILTVDSYNQFRIDGQFRYDTQLAEAGKGNNYTQQRAGIQIKFSNGKYWRVDLMLENGVYKVQYATHSEGTLFTWKTVHNLTNEQIAKYCSQEGIQLSVLRDGNYAWVCLDGKPVAIEVLDAEYANLTAQLGFEGWIANQQIEEMGYNISETVNRNLRSFYFTTNTKWDISGQMEGVLTLPKGGSAAIPFYGKYTDVDLTLKNVKEHDTTGKKPGRTDILLEFDTNGDGKADKSVSFGIVCTDRATNTCWVQTLGNADNYIPATRIKGLYKLSAEEAAKYLSGKGVELQVIRKGTDAYVFLEDEEVAIWDLTQNGSGVIDKTPMVVSVRHYDAAGDVIMNFEISGEVGEIKVDKVFKDNEKWDLSKEQQGVVSLPGGGTDTSLQFFKQYQNIDLTVKAKENDATGQKPGRTDVLFEFDLDNDGTMDKNVSFGIVQLAGGRCVLQTLGWADKYLPAKRINELYALNRTQTEKYKSEGVDLRVVRYETMVYLYLDEMQVAVFDLTQNDSGVLADSKATMLLRHYDAVADAVVIPFKVTDQVEKPEIVEQLFVSNFDAALWDISGQYDGYVTVIGGGGSTGQPLQFAGAYENMDLTLNVKDYADSATASRTDVEFTFDVDGDGKIDTAKGDQTVTFGVVYTDGYYCIQTRAGTLLNWKRPYEMTQAEIDQYIIDAKEIAEGKEKGLDFRMIRYGTTMYLFIENKQVAICDLTKCANSAGDKASGVKADTKMSVYLRHYDDKRTAGVEIPFSISTEVEPVEVSIICNDKGTVTTNPVNYYVNNGRTAKYSDTHFKGERIILTAKPSGDSKLASLAVNGTEVTMSGSSYSFTATESNYEVQANFKTQASVFASNYDAALWDISGQHDGYVTVIGGGDATAQPLQFAGMYQNVDLTLNARDYADASAKSRTEFGFEFDVDGDGVINTAKGDQTVTFGIAEGDRIQTRGGTLLDWKTPYDLSAAEKAQLVIDANEIAVGNEDGLDLRVIRYGTTMYLFIENKQVAICDLTKCANSAGDKASGVKADTKMFVYLRHYDDKRAAGVKIPFSISTEVEPVEVSIICNDKGTVTTNPVNYYVNNGRTAKYSDTHFMGEKIVLTAKPNAGASVTGFKVNGIEATLNADGTYSFTVSDNKYEIHATFEE